MRMDGKDELRRRRQDRIRQLLKGRGDRYAGGGYDYAYDRERRLREDPEYVWNQYGNPWRRGSTIERSVRRKTVASLVVFAAVWAMFQWNHPLSVKGQEAVKSALSQELQLSEFASWYEDKLGETPVFIPVLERSSGEAQRASTEPSQRTYVKPVSGNVIEPFGSVRSGAGVVVRTASGEHAVAMDTGLVVFAGETSDTGQTVIVQHPGGVQTVYGYLSETKVAKDDWVEPGEIVGIVRSIGEGERDGVFYFSIKKGNSFVDPTDVVAI